MANKHFMIYCINYGQSFDDDKFFETLEDAKKCEEGDRILHGLKPEDKLIGVKIVKVWKRYIPKRYGHDKVKEVDTSLKDKTKKSG